MDHSNNTSPIAAIKARVPPLPTKISTRPIISGSTHLDRQPTTTILNSISTQKGPTRASVPQDIDRRRSIELNMRGQNRLLDSGSQMPVDSNHLSQMNHHSYSQAAIASDLVKILKDENRNLKEQNNFLMTKLRQATENEKQLRESIADYQFIIVSISKENKQLVVENREIIEIANKKVGEIGQRIAELMAQKADQELPTEIRGRTDHMMQQFQTGSTQHYLRLLSNPYTGNQKYSQGLPPQPPKNHKVDNSTIDSQMQELHNQFQALIYSCRVEKNLETRKNIRKKLVELTYRMKELKKKELSNRFTRC